MTSSDSLHTLTGVLPCNFEAIVSKLIHSTGTASIDHGLEEFWRISTATAKAEVDRQMHA
jgi:hypothetical protein